MGEGVGQHSWYGPFGRVLVCGEAPACPLDRAMVGVQEEFMGRHDASQKRCVSQIELVVGG